MISFNEMKKISGFYENLGDEESKRIYEARWKYCNDYDRVTFIRKIIDMYSDWRLVNFTSYYKRMIALDSNKKLVIYGFGNVGKANMILLEKCGYTVDYIVDRNYQALEAKRINGESIPIYSPEKVFNDKENPIVIISISDLLEERTILRTLRQLYGLYSENIYFDTNGGLLLAVHGNQYFDLPYMKKDDEEIFIDGGCYDGATTKCFQSWAGEKFKQSIAFECDKRNIPVIKNNMKDLMSEGKFILVEAGLYSSKSELHFVETTLPTGSNLNETGKIIVAVDSIDNVLGGKKATFIKMDVQGVELEALKGAEKTIRQYYPKLAISLYHKNEDIYEIPLWLMEIAPKYKFYIRHYNTDECETVLYAIRNGF